jgi:sugar-phosphatase
MFFIFHNRLERFEIDRKMALPARLKPSLSVPRLTCLVNGNDSPSERVRSRFLAREFLFDLDGTLLDSIPAVERAWELWAIENGINPAELPNFHGRPSRETLSTLVSPDTLDEAVQRIQELETQTGANVQAKEGAVNLLNALPDNRWAVVTSGHRDVSLARMTSAGLPIPQRMVTGDDVERGKPDPEPFLRGQSHAPSDETVVVAFEDTIAGIHSAHAAGCFVIGVAGTHSPDELAGECDVVIETLLDVHILGESDTGVEIEV